MYQYILSFIHLINPRRNVPELPLCPYFIKVGRENPHKLFYEVIDRLDAAVQKYCNISGEEVGVLDKNTSKRKIDNKG